MSEKTSAKEPEGGAKTLLGRVVSDKMDKTIAVRVDRLIKHPLYGKYVRRFTRLMAHDEDNVCRTGDLVVLEASRPISRHKAWKLREVISRAEEKQKQVSEGSS